MADKKTETQPEETQTETRKLVSDMTLDEVNEKYPVLDGIPGLPDPRTLSLADSIKIGRVLGKMREAYRQFGQILKDTPDDAPYADTVTTLGMVEDGDACIRGISKDVDAYDKWTRGKDPSKLAFAYFTLLAWYEGQLGK